MHTRLGMYHVPFFLVLVYRSPSLARVVVTCRRDCLMGVVDGCDSQRCINDLCSCIEDPWKGVAKSMERITLLSSIIHILLIFSEVRERIDLCIRLLVGRGCDNTSRMLDCSSCQSSFFCCDSSLSCNTLLRWSHISQETCHNFLIRAIAQVRPDFRDFMWRKYGC